MAAKDRLNPDREFQLNLKKCRELMEAHHINNIRNKEGKVVRAEKKPALQIQAKGVALHQNLLKLLGYTAPEKHELSGTVKVDRQMDQKALKNVIESFKHR